jgi:riboflavin synthase
MFTGLVEGKGRILFVRRQGEGMDLAVELGSLQGDLAVGDSLALSGCCTTITRLAGGGGAGRKGEVHLTKETLSLTWFGRASTGRELNLERALTPASRMGGHFVQGHVDGLGKVLAMERRPDGCDLILELPSSVERFCVHKGSITVDGVSLTLAEVGAGKGRIALIPHTMEVTTLGGLTPGMWVHLEADLLGKYVARFVGKAAPEGP